MASNTNSAAQAIIPYPEDVESLGGSSGAHSSSVRVPTIKVHSRAENLRSVISNFSLSDLTDRALLCNAETKVGRISQLAQILFFALVASTGIFVQVYTDAENGVLRNQRGDRLDTLRIMAFEIYDVITLLAAEMEPFYEYNRGPYDLFLQKAQISMRNVDTKFIRIYAWPSDLSALPAAGRVNISTPTKLKTALRASRDARKAANGTSETDVINFYSSLVDNLAIAIRSSTIYSDRFAGWRELLTIFYTYQTFINFRKYAVVGHKLCNENRTIAFNDPIYRSLLQFYNRYVEFVKILSISSDTAVGKVRNLTEQDVMKTIERLQGFVLVQDFSTPSGDEWNDAMSLQASNILWISESLAPRVQGAMTYGATLWDDSDIFSVFFFALAALCSLLGILFHVYAVYSIQRQIVESHKILKTLNETLSLLFDCVPRAFVPSIKANEIFSPRSYADTCVLIMDIENMHSLRVELELEDFYDLLTDTFERIEARLVKYNCFKVDVLGNAFCLAAGIGEHHYTDHIGEMLFLALELMDDFSITDYEDRKAVSLQIGLHTGPCFAKVITGMRVPQAGIFGPAIQVAALIHATGLSRKIHISQSVHSRVSQAEEFECLHRGTLKIDHGITQIATYWARWSDDNAEEVDDERRGSLISAGSAARRRKMQ